MIKEITPNTKYKKEIMLNNRKERERMYFIKLNKINKNNKQFEDRRFRREKMHKIMKQPKGNKYIELYYGLCRYAIKHGNKINYRTERFIYDFYNDNKEKLQDMRICEIIEGLKMLNLIELITINEDSIKLNDYKALLQLEEMRILKEQCASR